MPLITLPLDPAGHPPGATNFRWDDAWGTAHASRLATNRKEAEAVIVASNSAILVQFRLLQQVRDLCSAHFGARFGGLKVTSFYRGVTLNKAVGGQVNSQHCLGEASDVHPIGVPPKEVYAFLVACARAGKLRFGQLLYEEGGKAAETTDDWIHISTGWDGSAHRRPQKKCGQVGRKLMGGEPHVEEIILAAA